MKNLIFLFLAIFVLFSCKQKTAEEYFEIGNSNIKIGNYKEAIVNFTNAIEINPKYAEAYLMRGKAYLGDTYLLIHYWGYNFTFNELEYNQFGRVVPADNNSPEESNSLEDITKAIELNPKFIEAYKLRAAIKIHKGYNIKAFADYNKIIEINPKDDECYSMRAKLKSDFGDYKSAIDDYRKAILVNPKKNLYYLRIGFNYSILKNIKEEIASFEKAYETDSTDAFILVYIADAKAKMKDHKGAIVYYTKYIENKYLDEKKHKKSDILISRGKAKILVGLIESGLADFSEAGQLGNEEAFTAIAEYEEEKGRIARLKKKNAQSQKFFLQSDRYYGLSTEDRLGEYKQYLSISDSTVFKNLQKYYEK